MMIAALLLAGLARADDFVGDLARGPRPVPVVVPAAPEPPAALTPEERQREVATRYAPVLMQGVNEGSADIDTPVDPFHRDLTNLLYDVKETATHYYLTYLVYHPADRKRIGVGDHQNDLEGVTVAVAKAASGQPEESVGVITLAHNEFFAHDLSKGEHVLAGRRVVVRIEPGSHGIYALAARAPGPLGRLKGVFNYRKHARDRLLAMGADRVETYEVGSPTNRGEYGLRLVTASDLARLTKLFEVTAGNGAKTPDQWGQGDRVAAGELWAEPEAVFRRLLKWDRAVTD